MIIGDSTIMPGTAIACAASMAVIRTSAEAITQRFTLGNMAMAFASSIHGLVPGCTSLHDAQAGKAL